MELRQITEEDREYVTSIIKMRWKVSNEEVNSEFDRWLIHDKNSVCFVGVIDGELMATGVFDTQRDEEDMNISPYNTLLWVEPKYRGNRYGEELSAIRYDWALKHDYQVIYLDTKDAFEYHNKRGWTLIKDVIARDGQPCKIMQKVLDNKLSFAQTRNVYDWSDVLKPLAEEFTAIFYQTMLTWCKIIPSDTARTDKYWEVWLIKIGDKQIGVCGLYTLHGATDTKELWLGWLGLIPEFRNFGLGKQVMEHLYTFAKSVGCERILSYVDKGGKPLPFYYREGFKVIGTVGEYCDQHCLGNIDGDDFEDKQDFVIMKELI